MTRPNDDRMTPEQLDEWQRLLDADDYGRRDLCGGIAVPLTFLAFAVAGGLILWGLL